MLRESLPQNTTLRGKEVFRIEALSDGVFAISVTLLIMSLEVPKTFAELRLIIRQILPFVATVSLVFFFWWQQNDFFRSYGVNDSKVKLLNLCLLTVILLYVFPLKFLFGIIFSSLFNVNYFETIGQESFVVITENDLPQLILFFSIGYALVWLIFYLLYVYVSHKKRNLDLSDMEMVILSSDKRDALVQLCIGCLSGIASLFTSLIISQLLFLFIPVWLTVNYYLTLKEKRSIQKSEHNN
jgi:uncharacterized membrane protein